MSSTLTEPSAISLDHFRLGVLDQSPVSQGSTGADALRHSIDLAQLTDALGFHRYWVAEHHGSPMLACASPEALIGPIASATSRIRVGSGGVMLPHYSALKVAETFSMFAGLFPDRIDLGIGRAPGSDPGTAFALQRDRSRRAPDDFPEQLAELTGYLENSLPKGHVFARLAALPGRPESPTLWLLGSSPQSAIWAGELGLPYVFADFINPGGAPLAELYRERFVPSVRLAAPKTVVAVSVICADTDAAAQRIAASARMVMTLFQRGQLIPVPPVDEAIQFLTERGLPLDAPPPGRRAIVGGPETVRAGILAVAKEYQAEEVLVVTITHEHEARRRSYALIASAFGLNASPPVRSNSKSQQ
jgi:luciferase family oxidoreductase group 1